MGSPLALRAIRERVPQPFRRPSLVAEWRNYYAATDLVTGGRGLPPGGLAHIHNHQRRGMPFPYHLPEDYLDHAPLAETLAAVLACWKGARKQPRRLRNRAGPLVKLSQYRTEKP